MEVEGEDQTVITDIPILGQVWDYLIGRFKGVVLHQVVVDMGKLGGIQPRNGGMGVQFARRAVLLNVDDPAVPGRPGRRRRIGRLGPRHRGACVL